MSRLLQSLLSDSTCVYSRNSLSRLVLWRSGGVLYSDVRVHGSNPCAIILYLSLGIFVGASTEDGRVHGLRNSILGGTEENPYDSRTRDDRSFDLRVKNGVDLAMIKDRSDDRRDRDQRLTRLRLVNKMEWT